MSIMIYNSTASFSFFTRVHTAICVVFYLVTGSTQEAQFTMYKNV